MKDYDCDISYHLGKANVVVDVLSRKSSGSLIAIRQLEKSLQEDFCRSDIGLIAGKLSTIMLKSTLLDRIKQGQKEDAKLIGHKESVGSGKKSDFSVATDGVFRFQGRICVPDDRSIKEF